MDISALNSRITFQKSTSVCDDVGNYEFKWTDYFSCFATVSGGNGDENSKNGDVTETETLNFTVRYCKTLADISSTAFRIVFNGKNYNIRYIDYMNYKKKSIKFKTELEV